MGTPDQSWRLGCPTSGAFPRLLSGAAAARIDAPARPFFLSFQRSTATGPAACRAKHGTSQPPGSLFECPPSSRPIWEPTGAFLFRAPSKSLYCSNTHRCATFPVAGVSTRLLPLWDVGWLDGCPVESCRLLVAAPQSCVVPSRQPRPGLMRKVSSPTHRQQPMPVTGLPVDVIKCP